MKLSGPIRTLDRFALSLCALLLTSQIALAQATALPALPEPLAAELSAIGRVGQQWFPSQGCSGTLIAPDLVVTAAHCVAKDGRSTNIFAVGWREGRAITSRRFKQEIRHPDYAPDGKHNPQNDVALIVLNAPTLRSRQSHWPNSKAES